jgi:hypothetical protein
MVLPIRKNEDEIRLIKSKFKHLIFKWSCILIENSDRCVICNHEKLTMRSTGLITNVVMIIFEAKENSFEISKMCLKFWKFIFLLSF